VCQNERAGAETIRHNKKNSGTLEASPVPAYRLLDVAPIALGGLMQKLTLAGLVGISTTLILTGAVALACGGGSDIAGGTGGGYSGDNSAAAGSFSASSSGSWGGPGDPPLPPISPGHDAGADAPFLCDGLDQSKPVVLYLSADDSNSMASPVLARELLETGYAPDPAAIRTYEFLNYYRIDYPAPPFGQLSILPQMENGDALGAFNLQLAVRSFDAVKPRRPITVTFVLDTSGSMGGPGIARERAAAAAIVTSLAQGDVVNMVTWNTGNNTLLSGYPVTGPSDPKVLALISGLTASGGTDLHSGLVAGYALAQANYGKDRLNRLILISDGGANVGVTDEDLIALHSTDGDKEGIYLVGIGAGPAPGYSDVLMDVVTDKGRGAYVYLDKPEEAKAMFIDRFDETMEVAARGVQVEMTLPWYFKIDKFYGEEYSSDPKQIEPQHLAPSDAMIFNQVVKSCDASMVKGADTIKVKATWQTPLTYIPQQTEVTMTVDQLLATGKAQLTKGKAIVAYAEALKTGTPAALSAAHAKVTAANAGGTDNELNEIQGLIEKHPKYQP
jgi:Ca-activated chloride channel homolog